jgi:hypothetical protein
MRPLSSENGAVTREPLDGRYGHVQDVQLPWQIYSMLQWHIGAIILRMFHTKSLLCNGGLIPKNQTITLL